jgi:hypothetical protein
MGKQMHHETNKRRKTVTAINFVFFVNFVVEAFKF